MQQLCMMMMMILMMMLFAFTRMQVCDISEWLPCSFVIRLEQLFDFIACILTSFSCSNIPSRAAFSIISSSVGRQQSIAEKAKVAMQGYLNHFLGNLEIVNSQQVS